MKLVVTIPYDENYEKVQQRLERTSYKKSFYHSIIPPHKIEYEFTHLSETGIVNIKSAFREIFADSQFKHICKFEERE